MKKCWRVYSESLVISMGILIACFVMLGGQEVLVKGREVQELGHDYSLMVPLDAKLPAMRVRLNACDYLEDPVAGYARLLKQQEAANKAAEADRVMWANRKPQAAQQVLPKEQFQPTQQGEAEYCLVDDWNFQACFYSTLEACMKVMVNRRGSACMERASLNNPQKKQ